MPSAGDVVGDDAAAVRARRAARPASSRCAAALRPELGDDAHGAPGDASSATSPRRSCRAAARRRRRLLHRRGRPRAARLPRPGGEAALLLAVPAVHRRGPDRRRCSPAARSGATRRPAVARRAALDRTPPDPAGGHPDGRTRLDDTGWIPFLAGWRPGTRRAARDPRAGDGPATCSRSRARRRTTSPGPPPRRPRPSPRGPRRATRSGRASCAGRPTSTRPTATEFGSWTQRETGASHSKMHHEQNFAVPGAAERRATMPSQPYGSLVPTAQQGPPVDGPPRPGRRRRRDHAVELAERARDARRRARRWRSATPSSSSRTRRRRSAAARCSPRSSREAGLPDGLLQIVVGGADVGEAIVTDPNVDARVVHRLDRGRPAGRTAGRRPAQEGRRSSSAATTPFIVLDDADLDAAAARRGLRRRSSSRARSASRPAATSSIAASPTSTSTLLTEKARRLRLGDPYREDVELGPIVNEKQLARVDGIVQRSVEGGARLVEGGTHEGLFYRPTVLADVTTDLPAWTDEIFGPVAPVVTFDTDDEARRARERQRVRPGRRASTRARSRAAWRSPTGSGPAWSTSTTGRSTTRRRSRSAGWASSGNGGRFGGEANFDDVHRVAVGDRPRRARARTRTRTERATPMASITEVARLAGVSTATASRVVSAADYPVSAGDARARARGRPDARLRAQRAGPRPAQEPASRSSAVIVHDITDPYFAEVVRGVEDAASPAGYLGHHLQLGARRRARALVRPAAALDARGGGHLRRAAASTTRRSNEEIDRHLAAMRADGAAVVHLSPHAAGEPEVGVDNAAGIAAMVAALVGARATADRVPRRPDVAVRRARAAGGLPPRPGGRRASRSTSGWSSRPASTARAARSASTRCSPATRRSPRSAAPTTCSRSGALAAAGRARDRRPGDGLGRRLRRHPDGGADRAEPVDRPAAAARDGPARVRARRPGRSPADDAERARSCRPRSSCASRPRAPRRRRDRAAVA